MIFEDIVIFVYQFITISGQKNHIKGFLPT